MTLQEFHQYFLQSTISDADSKGIMKPQAFFELVCDDLVNVGDLTDNYTPAEYIKRGFEVYGYDIDSERKILTLLTHQFYQEEELQTLTQNEIDTKFKRLTNFFFKCVDGIYPELEETTEAYSMAYNIYKLLDKTEGYKIRLMLLTDGKATRNLIEIPSDIIKGRTFEYRVVDIEYLYAIYSAQNQTAHFEIELNLPCLKVNSESDAYQSYLAVVDGKFLMNIYEKFGQKLFEQNVRTFLQFRGNVNKGLRNTIEYKPEMFFAYNNGITATATSVSISKEGNIQKIENFQIVNGGQTTSAIYAAYKLSGLDVSKVSVQMKLSVVKEKENQNEFVSKVAEYANTQNKISNSDFFSNSPFHKEIKEFSKRVYAPAIGGSQRRKLWFYERVRGEYLNNQAYLKNEAKTKFLLENPKDKVVDKTLLSKTENVWKQQPDIVSKGAQESFKKFADDITQSIENDKLAITETYFKEAMSRVILFRATERLVTAANWYDGGFRAQTVAYTISYLSYLIEKHNLDLNFQLIWEHQDVPQDIIALLTIISEKVYDTITHPPAGFANISQWTKNSRCWSSVKTLAVDLDIQGSSSLINLEEAAKIKDDGKSLKRLDDGISRQVFVLGKKTSEWQKLSKYFKDRRSKKILSTMEAGLLESMATGKIKLPSEKQSKFLYDMYIVALDEGLNLS